MFPVSNGSPCGSGSRKNHHLSHQKWTTMSIACKSSSNLILIKMSSSPQDRLESYFGCGKTTREALSSTRLLFLSKGFWLKLYLFQEVLKQFLEPKKVSLSFGTFHLSCKTTLSPNKEEQLSKLIWWTTPTKYNKWKRTRPQQQSLFSKCKEIF